VDGRLNEFRSGSLVDSPFTAKPHRRREFKPFSIHRTACEWEKGRHPAGLPPPDVALHPFI
jgi:hypothetical protein